MEILFRSKKLERSLIEPALRTKTYGTMARRIHQRVEELRAARNLQVMRSLPAAHCHELSGKWENCFAVSITGNFRIIFEPVHEPIPRMNDGSIDWEKITRIRILEIVDYN